MRRFRQPELNYRYWWLPLSLALVVGAVSFIAPALTLLFILLILGALLFLPRIPIWLIVASFIGLLALPFTVEGPLGAEFSPQNVGLPIILFLAIDQVWQQPAVRRQIRLRGLVAVYALVSFASVAAGPALKGGVADLWIVYRLVLIGPLAYFALSILFSRPDRIEPSIKFLAVAASIIGLFGMLQTLTNGEFPPGMTWINRDPRSSVFRAYGTFQHPNVFGVFLSTTVFLTWSIFTEASTRRQKLFWLGAIGLQTGGVVASFSRTAWVATAAGVAVIALLSLRGTLISRRAMRRGLVAVAIGLLFFLVAYYRIPAFENRLSSITNPRNVGEFQWRMAIWDYALREIVQHPLLGKGTTAIAAEAVGFDPEELASFSSHNLLISMAYGRGLIVTALFVLITFVYGLVGLQLERKRRLLGFPKTLISALLAAMTAFQVSGIGTATMNWANLSILYWFMVALMFSIYNQELTLRQSSQANIRPSNHARHSIPQVSSPTASSL